jgi:pullulanase-type alpha-1,6-glucosidase
MPVSRGLLHIVMSQLHIKEVAMYPARRVDLLLRLLVVLAVVASSMGAALTPTDVWADHTPAPTGVALVGSLQDELGCPGDWQPECANSELAFDTADDLWQATFALPVGNFEYKVALNDAWDENYGAGAAANGPNIALNLSEASSVKFYYDHKSHWITSNQNAVVAVAPGSFQSELGCPGDWQPDCLRSWLQDTDGDGIYTLVTSAIPAGDYEGKVALNESWDVNYGVGGEQNGPNITFTVAAGDTVTFRYDAVSHILTITAEGSAPQTTVAVAGSLQSELGCPGDWQPECPNTELAYDANDDVYQATFNVPAGDWEYKAALNDSWDENYGANAQRDGPNIPLNLTATADVKFYYDHQSHWITSNQNAVIAVAPGNFQSELGCSGDWQPDCLRSWLQDTDGDGVYTLVTSALPAGDYEAKVAINESWDENYGVGGEPNGPNIPFTVAAGDSVSFSYNAASHLLTITVSGQPGEDLAAIVQPVVRHPIVDDVFYFVMPDRFDNGDAANDNGGLSGDRLVTGLDPIDKGFYHGGDLAGLLGKMDYLQGLGVTAIWMTPMFKNRPVQGSGADLSAGYHGYWITDFTQIDPHFGANAELHAVIDAAHARGIKIFFDIITNHTADVIQYQEGQYTYRNKSDFPYLDASGVAFDDRDYVGGDAFPPLDAETSFPYTPVFNNAGDETVKQPAWLNNPIYYHNRGNSTFIGENSLYGDFFGLDDLFTEQPAVVDGLIDIYKFWISNFDIDGFRVDTVKHVNAEFWQQFAPAILEHAASEGKANFFIFGEVFSGNPLLLSYYTTSADMPAVLDFQFQEGVQAYVSAQGPADRLKTLFENDDYYTDADSNAYALPTFIGNHDRGRFGYFLKVDNGGALTDAQMLARTRLAHALMYFTRGVPVVYYGDEQGFVGDGGDKDARQDMMPSRVPSYNDDDLIATDATTADANFDQTHPIYTSLAAYAALRVDHPALARGAQIHRYSSATAGIYAFSRMDRDARVEYLVAVNNSNAAKSANIPTFYPSGSQFNLLYAEGGSVASSLSTNANSELAVETPALGLVIYQASSPLAPSEAAPAIAIANLTNDQEAPLGVQMLDGNRVPDRLEIKADVTGNVFAEVTFAVRPTGATSYTVVGVDDNPPYRVFYDASELPAGTTLEILTIANDLNGHLAGAKVTGVKPVTNQPPPSSGYDYAVIHYLRPSGDYGDETSGDFNQFWGLHLWGDAIDPSEVSPAWEQPKAFLGEDDYGRFAWIKLQDSSKDVNFIVHKGDAKDGTIADRKFNPNSNSPEIWLKQDDANFYTSRAAAQGYVTIHYHRPDGLYDGWGLHLWGDGLGDGVGTTWDNPRPFDALDDFGAYWNVPINNATKPVNFIIHKGDEKDPGPDQSMNPGEGSDVWINSGDTTNYKQPGAAQRYAVIHYHRVDGDYGDATSPNFADFWGLHMWTGAASPNPTWQEPVRPAGEDKFGIFFQVPLAAGASELAYILHRGDTKDPGPDQFLNLGKYGYEVWQLENVNPEKPYVLPILKGVQGGGDLSKYQAHWVSADTLAWDTPFDASLDYTLHYAADGGMKFEDGGLTGGLEITLTRDPAGLSDAIKAKFPHLANFTAFQIGAADLDKAPDALKGQLAMSARNADGLVINATGLQIPGVLDDLYTYDGELGASFGNGAPTLRLWAPTARSIKLHLFDSASAATASQVIDMVAGDQGTWSASGDATWVGQYYLYEVEVYVHATGKVEHNLVTDPYSLALSTNSQRTLLVNLDDPALQPEDWEEQARPPLAAPEDSTLYELHVRDFSINDASVPDTDRGLFQAFTHSDSNGMVHLKKLATAGLTHVHLLPAFDCATINEDKAARLEPTIPNAGPDSPDQQAAVMATADQDGFNWCYDPYHYTVPEGSYATDPDGVTRIIEFRQMVQALHAAGLRVVMDVVYNHTSASGQSDKSVLDKIVPGYYHRLNADGKVETSTCCQNTASEHAMFEKLMIDSLKVWASAYKVDGFRFDLMGHHMKANMEKVQAALQAIDPTIYLYGEGWNFGEVVNNERGVNATQLNLPGTGIGAFNDRLRDAVRGGGPFDGGNTLVTNQGFISGLYYDPNADDRDGVADKAKLLLYQDQIRVGLAGNLADYEFMDRNGNLVKGSQIDYNGSPAGYTQDPQEHIIYVEAHDNQTLYDIEAYKHPLTISMADRVRAHNVGLAVNLLAQGVPFIHAGQEMLRSKSMDRNSYNSGDWFNKLDFTYASNNWGVGLPPKGENGGNWNLIGPRLANPQLKPAQSNIEFAVNHLVEMLQIRQSSPLFRLQSESEVVARLRFYNTGPNQLPGLIVMQLSDEVTGLPDLDPQHEQVVVLFNAGDETVTFGEATLAGMTLQLHPLQSNSSDEVVRTAAFDSASGAFTVPARTTAVFVDRGGATQITIQLDAQPDSIRNFRFIGDLGEFRLDDSPDADRFTNTITFDVAPGQYTVREETPFFWHLTAVSCDPTGSGDFDRAAHEVTISVVAGQQVTCTFVNQFSAQLLVRKYHDRNGNGERDRELGLRGWQISLYDNTRQVVDQQETNAVGKANFWNLAPGGYTVCEQLRPGWFNSQPGTVDPAHGDQPCYTIELLPAQLWTVQFGNHQNAAQVGAASAQQGAASTIWRAEADDDQYDAGWFVDRDLNTPEQGETTYLPMVQR